jgi:23S rRNA pseudouridine2605 synthase
MSEIEKKPRIAKFMAAAGICSRREAEQMIADGRVTVDGKKLQTPAFLVEEGMEIRVDGKMLPPPQITRLWKFHKPRGVITSRRDEKGRPTIYDLLPKELSHLHSIGRLDFNSEGLLLLTNDGGLKREYELPATGIQRKYRVRILGKPQEETLRQIETGITIDGVRYQGMKVTTHPAEGRNCWVDVVLKEGKNREIRRVFEHFDHQVSKLIRTHYGKYALAGLPAGQVEEVFIPRPAGKK